MNLLCDNCQKEFDLSDKSIKKILYPHPINGVKVEVIYFQCPNCKEVFIVQILNDLMKDYSFMINDKQKKWNDIICTNDSELIKENSNIYTSIMALKKKSEKEKNRLLKKYGKKIKAYLKAKT